MQVPAALFLATDDPVVPYERAASLKAALGARLVTFEARKGGHRVAPFADDVVTFVRNHREDAGDG